MQFFCPLRHRHASRNNGVEEGGEGRGGGDASAWTCLVCSVFSVSQLPISIDAFLHISLSSLLGFPYDSMWGLHTAPADQLGRPPLRSKVCSILGLIERRCTEHSAFSFWKLFHIPCRDFDVPWVWKILQSWAEDIYIKNIVNFLAGCTTFLIQIR